jgi:hypothetical protein
MTDLQVFTFEEHKIRVFGDSDVPEWIASDVCAVLEITYQNPHGLMDIDVVFSLFDLYAIAVDLAEKDLDKAYETMRLVRATANHLGRINASVLQTPAFGGATGERLYYSTMIYLTWASSIELSENRGIHPWFESNLDKLIPGATLTSYSKPGIRLRPDFWVIVDGSLCPVEIKRDFFTARSLEQLKRYLEVFDCDRGYAVARKLKTKLPKNIEFIPVTK